MGKSKVSFLCIVLGGAVFVQTLMTFLLLNSFSLTTTQRSTSTITNNNKNNPILPPSSNLADWQPSATFTGHCQAHKLSNETWGEPIRKYVDKYDAKQWVQGIIANDNIVQIVPTVALYDASNLSTFTTDAMVRMSQRKNIIIKPTHAWAVTARVWNQTYNCFRFCVYFNEEPVSMANDNNNNDGDNAQKAHDMAMANMKYAIQYLPNSDYIREEPQYKNLPQRVIVEEHLDSSNQEYHWWVVHGQPVFVCARCDIPGHKRGSYYTSDFRPLNIQSVLEPCPLVKEPPVIWNRMLQSVREIGRHIPGIVSIDLYANDTNIFFSELTFTRDVCKKGFQPWSADSLLHRMETRQISTPSLVTADYVWQTVHDQSWVLVEWDGHWEWQASYAPSAVDLCQSQKVTTLDQCLEPTKNHRHHDDDIHCAITKEESRIEMFPLRRKVTLGRLMERLDCSWAIGILLLSLVLSQRSKTQTTKKEVLWMYSLLYLVAVSIYKSRQNTFTAWWDPSTTLASTAIQSFQVFTKVHPVTSVTVALTHFATYWVPLAAVCKSRSLSEMLLWWFAYEIGTALVNEWSHFVEPAVAVRCTRVAFIANAKRYALNDVIRAYILPPFFVYGYLLPKFLLHFIFRVI